MLILKIAILLLPDGSICFREVKKFTDTVCLDWITNDMAVTLLFHDRMSGQNRWTTCAELWNQGMSFRILSSVCCNLDNICFPLI